MSVKCKGNLATWAEQDKDHSFFDLYHLLYDEDWLRLAHDYVKQNAGSSRQDVTA